MGLMFEFYRHTVNNTFLKKHTEYVFFSVEKTKY